MKRGLSGYLPVRNGNRLDYCWQLVVRSMLPVCDELIICDSDSDDGTREEADEMAIHEPKIRVINRPWPNPVGDGMFLPKWLNDIRQHCEYDMQLTSDADEVLHPDGYDEIRRAVKLRECRWFRRYNFWRDPQHLVPEGMVCGTYVARLGPTNLAMVSDEMHPEGEPEIKRRAKKHDSLKFWHLGFLRRQEAFFAKSKVVQPAICNSYDPRLTAAEETGRPWHEVSNGEMALVPYHGQHPEIVKEWLRERGYRV